MFPSTKERMKRAPFFHKYYLDVCKLRNIAPITFSKHHIDKNMLDLCGDKLKIEEWLSILEALKNDRSLHSIAIRSKYSIKKVFEEADTEVKARLMKRHPVLFTRFLLRLLMIALADCIRESNVLNCIELEGLPLKSEYITFFSKGISTNATLQTISFHSSIIGDDTCQQLCLLIRNMLTVFHLDLSNCNLTNRSAKQIAEVLKNQSLQHHSEGWKQSLRYRDPNIQSMPGLRRIILNNNPKVGDKGIEYLTEVLKEDIWLKAIDLQNCGISNRGAQHILEMLDFNVTLYIVDVRDNPEIDNILINQIMLKLMFNNTNKDAHEYNWTIPQSLLPHLSKPKSSYLIQKAGKKSNISMRRIPLCSKQKKVTNSLFTKLELTKNSSKMSPDENLPQLTQTSMKLTEVVECLEKEIHLRKKAELEQEELRIKINDLENELWKEKEEKKGFCLLKMEAYEAILETLINFSTFMEHIVEANESKNQERYSENDMKILLEAHVKSIKKVANQEKENKLCSHLKQSTHEMAVPMKLIENKISKGYNFNTRRKSSEEGKIHVVERKNNILCDVSKALMSISLSKNEPVTHANSSVSQAVDTDNSSLNKPEIPVLLNTYADSQLITKVTHVYEQFIEHCNKKGNSLQTCKFDPLPVQDKNIFNVEN